MRTRSMIILQTSTSATSFTSKRQTLESTTKLLWAKKFLKWQRSSLTPEEILKLKPIFSTIRLRPLMGFGQERLPKLTRVLKTLCCPQLRFGRILRRGKWSKEGNSPSTWCTVWVQAWRSTAGKSTPSWTSSRKLEAFPRSSSCSDSSSLHQYQNMASFSEPSASSISLRIALIKMRLSSSWSTKAVSKSIL